MQKIAIIGNAGGGKSILAQELGQALKIPVYKVDSIQWRPDWEPAPAEEIDIIHKTWINQPAWVIDGWGNWDILKERFDKADTLIFIDYALWVHYWWATKRQVKAVLKRNPGWPPEGCKALPITWRLFRLIRLVHTDKRPELIRLVDKYSDEKEVVYLRSPKEMERFRKRIMRRLMPELPGGSNRCGKKRTQKPGANGFCKDHQSLDHQAANTFQTYYPHPYPKKHLRTFKQHERQQCNVRIKSSKIPSSRSNHSSQWNLMLIEKVAAFITRKRDSGLELLLFEHPHAGIQIPAGTVEPSESPEGAALREAVEETGLSGLTISQYLGEKATKLPGDQRVIGAYATVYARPDINSFDWIHIRPGITVSVIRKAEQFVQILYQEFDREPESQYITYSIMGWVLAEVLADTRRRHFYHLEFNGPSPERWRITTDTHIFAPFWAPLNALPDIIPPQKEWLIYLDPLVPKE